MTGRLTGELLLTGALLLCLGLAGGAFAAEPAGAPGYVGSSACRPCHERFYNLWATSHHGLALQPFTAEFARDKFVPQAADIKIGERSYRAQVADGKGWVREQGPDGEKRYPIEQVMGGKNVYYFLTPLERGRLQVLPVEYDLRSKKWLDTAASGVRHFPDVVDEALDWRHRAYTFNTSCFGCHVSQLAVNYDLKTDAYRTEWKEPGINCETCHGPAEEHVRVCKAAPMGQPPADLKLVMARRSSGFTAHQVDSPCAACHAKLSPITAAFKPGDEYFNHFDLIALEHRDFYPDGRDLGENYTYTSWRMSPCAKSGQLDCLHCHTSSGRNRFEENPNAACLPCHEERVKNAAAHSRHKADGAGNHCVGCHMPKTAFAAMMRSDHSMRPPTPATTLAHKSPNACNICHADKDAAWSERYVREWRARDYQKPVLHWAGLIAAARKNDWARLPETLEYLHRSEREEIVAVSLVRLLENCEREAKWPVLIKLLKDASPLVRAGAAQALDGRFTAAALPALLAATGDKFRLVRVRAAASLAAYPPERLNATDRESLNRAVAELMQSLNARPDDSYSHYNLGNFYLDRQQHREAIASFETAIRLQPDGIMPYINSSIVYNLLGQNAKAEANLRKAIKVEPKNVAAHLNLALLLGETGRLPEAEQTYRQLLKLDPKSAVAAYNLGVLLAEKAPAEALAFCRQAYRLSPGDPKYGYTLAFYLRRMGEEDEAAETLLQLIQNGPPSPDAYRLLGDIYLRQGKANEAASLFQQAAADKRLSAQDREMFTLILRQLQLK